MPHVVNTIQKPVLFHSTALTCARQKGCKQATEKTKNNPAEALVCTACLHMEADHAILCSDLGQLLDLDGTNVLDVDGAALQFHHAEGGSGSGSTGGHAARWPGSDQPQGHSLAATAAP